MTDSDSKTCSGCGQEKPLTDFRLAGRKRMARCKECERQAKREYNARPEVQEKHRAAQRRYYRKHRERLNAQRHERWPSSAEAKAAARARQREYQRKNPAKHYAHTVVRRALDKGELVKPVLCSGCHKAASEIEAHHEDYSKPLEVIWLCRRCHKAKHPRKDLSATRERSITK